MKINKLQIICFAGLCVTSSILYSDWMQDDDGNWTLGDTSTQETLLVDSDDVTAAILADGSWTVGTEEAPTSSDSIVSMNGENNSFTNSGEMLVYNDASAFAAFIAPEVTLNEGSTTSITASGLVSYGIADAKKLNIGGSLVLNNTSTSLTSASNYGIYSPDNLAIEDLSGSVNASVSRDNVPSDSAMNLTSISIYGKEVSLGKVSGEITSSVTVGNVALESKAENGKNTLAIDSIGIVASDLTISELSGTITATAQTAAVEEGADAIKINDGVIRAVGISGDTVEFTNGFTGSITATADIAGESTALAAGIVADTISGNLDGTITVSADDVAIGVFLQDDTGADEAASITVNGTIKATVAEVEATGETEEAVETADYAIYAGSYDVEDGFEAGDDSQVLNLGVTSSITGKVDLTGGDDTVNFVTTLVSQEVEGEEGEFELVESDTEGNFNTDQLANVEHLNILSGVWQLGGTYDLSSLTIDGGMLHTTADMDVAEVNVVSGGLWASEGTLSNVDTVTADTTLRLSETGTWAGVVELAGGTLRLEREYTLNSENLTLTSGTVDFDADATLTWEFATLAENQTLILNKGVLKPTTDVAIDGGTFDWQSGDVDLNNHTISGADITVPENGTLYGIGTIDGSVVNSGKVRPGYSPGTITITGDFTQTSTGSLVMEILDHDYDVLSVAGAVTLDGTLDLTADLLQNDVDYTLISTDSSIDVKDSFVVNQDKATRKLTWNLSDGGTELHFEINHINYTNFAQNTDQKIIASTLDKVYPTVDTDSMMGQLIMTVDNFKYDESVTKFLSGLAAPMSMNTGVLIEQGTDVMNLIKDQQSQTPSGSYVWAKGVYGDMDFDASGNYGERSGHYNGAVSGVTMSLGDSNWNLGGVVSTVKGKMSGLSHYENDTSSIWLVASNYMPSENGGWNKAIRVGFGYSDIDVDAYDRFFFNGDHINSSYSGDTISGFAEYAINKQFGKWIIEPSAGLTFQRHSDDAHDDTLNSQVLRSWDDVDSNSVKGTLGCRFMYPIEVDGGSLIPFVNARFEYQFEDAPEGTYTWSGTTISGTIDSAEWDGKTARINGGLIYSMDSGWSISVAGDLLEGDTHGSYGGNVGVSYNF